MKHSSSSQLIYTTLGTGFLVLGALTVLNIAAAMQVGGVFLWGAAVYAAMDFLIAYGLYQRQWWIPYAFALNLVGIGAIFFITALLSGTQAIDPLYYAVALGLNALLAAFLYQTCTRRPKKTSPQDTAGVVFVLLWALTFCQTLVNNFI